MAKHPIEDGWQSLIASGTVDPFDAAERKMLRWMFFAGASYMFSHIVEVSTPASAELDRFGKEINAIGRKMASRERKVQ